ncbi:Uncharacterised protein [Mycobacteroides abscessus subsp. abscessus]|nr:hypothetical protein L830_1918 [Mycobacteroides abscessus MAB_082312_2258]CPZ22352.1 Uncharacterised protein [Mycobacteroides abscessus]SIB94009.1 Uncharacterised protein [Mycobacteroides abscessus subsp. abscessus]SKY38222.1 Uncharacterised protein [Mycobacteroides abscessus subsp. abscessus]
MYQRYFDGAGSVVLLRVLLMPPERGSGGKDRRTGPGDRIGHESSFWGELFDREDLV